MSASITKVQLYCFRHGGVPLSEERLVLATDVQHLSCPECGPVAYSWPPTPVPDEEDDPETTQGGWWGD